MGHNHITISERESICKGVSQYLSRIEIAMSLKMSKSTISRELKRNSENGSYSPVAAGGGQILIETQELQKRTRSCRTRRYAISSPTSS